MTLQTSRSPLSVTQRIRQLSPRWLVGLGLLGVLLIAIPVFRVRSAKGQNVEQVDAGAVLPVETVTATQVDFYEVARTYTGEVAALRSSDLGFERGGQLTGLLVPEGGRVRTGEPLAQLDVQNLRTQRLQVEAERARAIAQLSELETGARVEDIAAAKAAVVDLEQQIGQGAISREALDEFSFGEGSLQARLDQARSQLAELQNGTRPEQISAQDALVQQLDARLADIDVNLAKSTLNAPFDGTVAAHTVDLGTVVGAGQSVVRLVESGVPEARVGVPASEVGKLSVGSERTVEVGGERYTGAVTSVLPEVDGQTRTQTVVLALESRAEGAVSPGQTVRLEIGERVNELGIWLPAEAITQGVRGLWTVYVVEESGASTPLSRRGEGIEEGEFVVEPQAVEVVHQEEGRVFVRGTLQPDAVVVSMGAHRLVPGQRVSLLDSGSEGFVGD